MENAMNIQQMRIDYIGDDLETYLNSHKSNSSNTSNNYRVAINQFMKLAFGKETKFVTYADLGGLTGNDVVELRNIMLDSMKSSTVNTKFKIVKKFFSYLETDNPEVRSSVFNQLNRLKENKTGSSPLSWTETKQMIEVARETESEEFAIMIELAFKTCIRLDSVLNLKWSEIFHKEHKGEKYWVIEVQDKGKPHEKPISDCMYETLLKLKVEGQDELFVSYHPHKVGRVMKKLANELEIDPRRKITFHSLKKGSINYVYDVTGDIMMAQKQGNHSSAVTTMDSYMEHKKDYASMPSYTMGEEVDMTALEDMSQEQLINLIKNASPAVQFELLRRAQGKA